MSSLALLLILAAGPGGLLLSSEPGPAPDVWRSVPDLLAWQTPPDILLHEPPTTFAEAAAQLVAADLVARRDDDPVAWLRLDGIDLCQVAECTTCALPGDPHEPRAAAELPSPATMDHVLFFRAVLGELAGRADRAAYLVVGDPAPEGATGLEGLTVLALTPEAESWSATGATVYPVVRLEDRFGLPLGVTVDAGRAIAAVGRAESLAAAVPEWLRSARAAAGRHPLGDPFRDTGGAFDGLFDLVAGVPANRLPAGLARLAAVVAELDRFDRGGPAPRDLTVPVADLPPALRAAASELARLPLDRPAVTLPTPPSVVFDGILAEGEWDSAAVVTPALLADGTPSPTPSTAWLAADEAQLHLAVSAGEEDPRDARLSDRVIVDLADGDGSVRRWTLGVDGTIDGPGEALSAALFDGPGFTLEARLPLGDARRLNLTIEHRHGYRRQATVLRPCLGARWPARWLVLDRQ